MPRRILITGASGYIGRHVASAALTKPELLIRLVSHRSAPEVSGGEQVDIAHADVSDPATLSGLCRDVDAVVHCATLISGDEPALRAVNDLGTAALVAEAQRHGVRRIVYVSTAAVYGPGPFRRAEPHDLPVRPASATSRTRARAEQHVLAAGGTVLRPHLVYGAGDRWVIPGLAALIRHLGAPVACTAVHSAVEVGALARVALEAALSQRPLPGAYHVNHPVPLAGSAVVGFVQGILGTPPARPLTLEQARERAAASRTARHHLDMLTADHWFLGDRIWRLLPVDPGPEPSDALHALLPWYRQLLS